MPDSNVVAEKRNYGKYIIIKMMIVINYFFRSGSEAVLPLVPVKEPEEMTTKMSTTQSMMPAFGVF